MASTHLVARHQVVRARTRTGGVGVWPDPPGRQFSVCASDGVRLAVREWGDPDSPICIVLSHGWTLSSRLWVRQIGVLSRDARVIAYDHRGHGASGRGLSGSCTLDQLGRDLGDVIDGVAPEGQIVLAGHSMGGMTIMHLAKQRPDLFAHRVDGVVIVSSSAGELGSSDLGLPGLFGHLVRGCGPRAMAALGHLEAWAERRETLGPELWLAVRALAFGPGATAHLVDEMVSVAKATPLGVVSAFYAALAQHDGRSGLRVLQHTPTTILVGTEDRLTPLSHSLRLAAALPHAELVRLEGAGHMLTLERPAEVAGAIGRYIKPFSEATEAGDFLVAP